MLPEVVWAALDRPSGFAIGAGDTVVVLGRMAARVVARPRAGCRSFNLIPGAAEAVAGAARVKALLGAQA